MEFVLEGETNNKEGNEQTRQFHLVTYNEGNKWGA